ncbi:MAG: hypothetical protein LBU82_06110 [Treponema sp.]|jgi:WD40 repeat protein|nr:hypothetical protein [Treponema sp.]
MRLFEMKQKALLVFLSLSASWLTAAEIPGGHRGAVTALISSGDRIISAGEDGFAGIWNVKLKTAQQRFQLTPYGIKAMVKHPLKDEICIIENGGMDQHGISVWNCANWEKLFTLRSKEPVTFVNYSAGGSFIIAGGYNGEKLSLFDSKSGKNIPFPDILTGMPALAVTGRAERNLLVYQSRHEHALSGYGGLLSYLNLNSASETNQFETPGGLYSPIVFGNNRFLAGINGEGLLVLDAATGAVLDGDDGITSNALLCPVDGDFYCANREGGDSILYRFAIDNSGNLFYRKRLILPFKEQPVALAATGGNVAFGTEEGEIFLLAENGSAVKMAHNNSARVIEIAVAKDSVAFLTENGELCFLPLDYTLLEKTQNLAISDKSGYKMISPAIAADEDQFLLWQTANTRLVPALINEKHQFMENRLLSFPARFPLRSVSTWGDKVLFLDSSGGVSVYDLKDLSKNAVFTFSSIGAIDAVFTDSNNFILCRGVFGGNSPFFIVNSRTSETLSVAYPARAGITAYAGSTGNIYAAALESGADGVKTKVLNISTAGAGKTILEYLGEDIQPSLAESEGNFAIAAGGEGAAIYDAEQKTVFERTEGLPVKLCGSPAFFISLDSEGGIAWHDNKTGKVLAVFRLYADRWTLTADREVTGVLSRLKF